MQRNPFLALVLLMSSLPFAQEVTRGTGHAGLSFWVLDALLQSLGKRPEAATPTLSLQ